MDKKNRFQQARENAGNESLESVAENSKVSKNTIWKLEHNMVDAGYKVVRRLAEYYQVNGAWLMGMPNTSPTLDESSQAVTKVTSLSEKAIENLQKITDADEKDAMNSLLESESFRTVVTWLSLAEHMIQHENITKVESWDEQRKIESMWDDNFNVEMKLSPKESARYFLSRAIQTTDDMLSLIIREQWTDKVEQWASKTIKEMKENGTR